MQHLAVPSTRGNSGLGTWYVSVTPVSYNNSFCVWFFCTWAGEVAVTVFITLYVRVRVKFGVGVRVRVSVVLQHIWQFKIWQISHHYRPSRHVAVSAYISASAATRQSYSLQPSFYFLLLFTARCYAERGYATVYCLSICPSVRPWRLGTVIT